MPPKPSKETIDLGVKYSPEFACFPLKVLMGSYIQSIEAGADTIFSSGGHGPCRAGFYGELHSKIIKSLGYDTQVIIFDEVTRDYKDFISKVILVKGKNSWLKMFKIVLTCYRMIQYMDILEKRICRTRAYEVKRGSCTRVWEEILEMFDNCYAMKDVKQVKKKADEMIDSIETYQVPEEQKIRIGVVGEIYVVMEPTINDYIEEKLGYLGAEVERSQYLSEWIEFNLIPKWLNKSHEKEVLKKGEEYIEIIIGGHAKQNVGHIVDFSDRGFDGIIHVMPFACLPELVSQSIIPKISKEHDIPVLTLSLDEQRGTANVQTRLEAFIDLVKNKKMKKLA